MKNAAKKTIVQKNGQKLVSFSNYRRAPRFQTFQKHAEWDSQASIEGSNNKIKRRGGGSRGKKLLSMLCSITIEVCSMISF